jgi:hypothetical protein
MVLTITPAPIVDAGSDEEICQGGSFNFALQSVLASASNFNSLVWTHSGSGTLFNGNSLTPTYFASPSETGIITFTLTALGNGSCTVGVSTMDILITPAPQANAGSDAQVCEGTPTFDFSSRTQPASIANGTLLWTHDGTGSLDDPTAVNPVYTVGAADIGNTITFTLTVTSSSSVCSTVLDQFILRVNNAALVSVPFTNIDVCEPSRINLSGFIGGSATGGAWSLISGNGTLSVSSITGLNITATYDLAPSDVLTSLVFRLTSNDPDGASGPCAPAFTEVTYNVAQAAIVNAGPDFEICEYDNIDLSGSFSGAATSVTWTGGTGVIGDPSQSVTTYTLTPAERAANNLVLIFTLTSDDPAGVCPVVTDEVQVTVNDTLNFVTFVGLGPVYQEDAPPVTLTGVPPGGIFSGPGIVPPNTFNPDFANLGTNIITYSYTDPSTGCVSNPKQSTIVNPVTTIDWVIPGVSLDGNGFPQICATVRQEDVPLVGIPDIFDNSASTINPPFFSSPDIPTAIIRKVDGQYYINTKNLTPGVYRVDYVFTNVFEATTTLRKNVTVFAAPKADFIAPNTCVLDPVSFQDNSSIPNNPFGDFIDEWDWNYGDGIGGSDDQFPLPYTYPDTGRYDVRLTIITDKGCQHDTTKVVRIGDLPDVNFSWTSFCEGDSTNFNDLTTVTLSSIIDYKWRFNPIDSIQGPPNVNVPPGSNEGRTSGTFNNPKHRYEEFRQYQVTLTVETNDGCINSRTKTVTILDYRPPAEISIGYSEDFESGQGTWFPSVSNNGSTTIDNITDPISWRFETPSGNIINSAASGSNAWWTGSNPNFDLSTGDRSYYFNNEKSAVIGPCLNLTDIARPMISIDYWSDLEDQRDGAVLQYSTDGGVNWEAIGDENASIGINWYNGRGLVGNPGLQPIGQYGWTDTSTESGWKTARYNLDMIPLNERDKVIFRVAFGSNNDNGSPERPYEGFAFDNIYIGEKKRNVLVEYFTNSEIDQVANDYLNNLYIQETFDPTPSVPPFAKQSSDFFKIQYHIANPGADPINQDNPDDPDARSLYYSISQPTMAVMDGILGTYYNSVFNGNQSKITKNEIDRRSLEDPLFEITLSQSATSLDSVKLEVLFKYIGTSPLTTPVTFQVALVDSLVTSSGIDQIHVLRKLLLGTEGVTINRTWNPNDLESIEVNSLVDVPVSNNLWLVAFVQDRLNRRIHQMILVKSEPKQKSTIVGIEEDPILQTVMDIQVYPNPASKILNLDLGNGFAATYDVEGYEWSLVDQRGITVLEGDFQLDQNNIQQIGIDRLANGMYILLIRRGDRMVTQRKIAVMNNH